MGNVLARIQSKPLIDGGHDREVAGKGFTVATTVTQPPNYNEKAVTKLIQERRLAPFYPDDPEKLAKTLDRQKRRPFRRRSKKTTVAISKEWLTTNMVECPICFSTYPRNINKTCCCDQPICTLCFVNLRIHNNRRICCPYCNQIALGVIYDPPQMIMMRERGSAALSDRPTRNQNNQLCPTDVGVLNPNSNGQPSNFYYVRRHGGTGEPQPTLVNSQNRQRQYSIREGNPYRPPAEQSQAEHPSHRAYYYQYSMNPFQ